MAASAAVDVSAQRRRSGRHSTDRSRIAGRYDAARTPLPPGGQVAAMPREENRAALQKQLKRLRNAIRAETSAEKVADSEVKRQRARAARDHLEAEAARLQLSIDAIGETVAEVGIIDPMGDGKATIRATVNRRTDILELERSHGRISEAAYRAGRIVQDVLEKAGRIGGAQWNTMPSDRTTTQSGAVARAMERAQDTRRMVSFIEGRLGMIDTRLLRRVLGDRMSFADCAALQGKSGEKGAAYIGGRVRDALEDLADAFASKGRTQPMPDDAYRAAAGEMAARQDEALTGGATLSRLEAELVVLEAGAPVEDERNRQRTIGETKAGIAGLRLNQAVARARRCQSSQE